MTKRGSVVSQWEYRIVVGKSNGTELEPGQVVPARVVSERGAKVVLSRLMQKLGDGFWGRIEIKYIKSEGKLHEFTSEAQKVCK